MTASERNLWRIAELNDKLNNLSSVAEVRLANWQKYERELKEAKEILHLFLKLKTFPCASGNSINMLQFDNTCKELEDFLEGREKE